MRAIHTQRLAHQPRATCTGTETQRRSGTEVRRHGLGARGHGGTVIRRVGEHPGKHRGGTRNAKVVKLAAWFVLDPVVPDSNTIMSNNKKVS